MYVNYKCIIWNYSKNTFKAQSMISNTIVALRSHSVARHFTFELYLTHSYIRLISEIYSSYTFR
jgi:hypothetical protein